MTPRRVFIAAPIEPTVRNCATQLQKQLCHHFKTLRLTRPDQFHLTLAFFAALPEEQVEILKVNMLSISRCNAPFQLEFDTFGAFPSFRRARVLWLGPSDRSAAPLCRLHAELTRRLDDASLPLERRPFHPHLTLGRARQPIRMARHLVEQWQPTPVSNEIDRLVLFESTLEPHGATHRALEMALLTGG